MSASAPISLTVTHRGTPHSLSLLPDSTLAALQIRLEELTSVPPSLQKLLYKGKKPSSGADDETTLSQAGFKHGMKIQMLGSTTEELGNLQATENEQKRRDRILRERALKAPTKVLFFPITPHRAAQ
jgi:Ubiquitin family